MLLNTLFPEPALEFFECLAAVTAAVLFRGAEFGAGAAEFRQVKVGIVTEPAFAGATTARLDVDQPDATPAPSMLVAPPPTPTAPQAVPSQPQAVSSQPVAVPSQPSAVPSQPVAQPPAAAPSGDLPVLADIPKIPRSTPEPVVVTDPTSPAATAIRRLALLVLHDVNGLETPSIAVGSARRGEGRTTVAANLACAMQQEGKQVLLVTDAHHSVIAPGVHVLPPGMGVGPDDRAPDDERLHQLLLEARDLVDVVVIDTTPLLDHADGARVAAACDRLLLVGVSGKTTRSDVDNAARLVEQNGTRVLGLATTERPNWLARRLDGRSVDE